jgi:hypothetical protein
VWVSKLTPGGFTSECQLDRRGARSVHARSEWRWTAGPLPDALARAAHALHGSDV